MNRTINKITFDAGCLAYIGLIALDKAQDKLCNYIHKHYPMINVVIFTVWTFSLAVYSAYAIKGCN